MNDRMGYRRSALAAGRAAAAVAAAWGSVAVAAADTVTLTAVADNTLYESADGSLSNGAGAYLFAGQTLRGGTARRAVVRFDLTGIPAGSTIAGASLAMNVSRNNAGAGTFTLHRVLQSWGEGASNAGEPGGPGVPAQPGDATWVHRFYPDTPWSTIGGTFVAAASSSCTVPSTTGPVAWTTGLEADVRAWVDGPETNFGWLINATSGESNSARRLDSRENTDPPVRPRLTVEFTPPPVCLADFNQSGIVSVQDIFDFLAAFFAMPEDPRADFNASGVVSVQDIFDFLAAYFAGCD